MLETQNLQETFARNEEFYRLLLDHVNNAVIATDMEGRIIYWNQSAQTLYQWSAGEVLGRSIFEVTVPQGAGGLAQEIMTSIQQKGQWDGEFIVRRKDDTTFPAHVRNAVIVDAAGKAIGYVGVSTDISRRVEIETELRGQTEVVETVNRIGQILSGELDLQKLVQAVTDAATELTGAHFGSFFYNVLDERGASYMLYTLSGVPREAFAHFPMPRSTDLFGPTFRGEGLIRIADVRQDPRYGKNSPYYGMPPGHLPVTSYLAVPVISRSGVVLGGLFFGHPEAGVFTEHVGRIVEGLAAQAAIAMDNAWLFDSAQRAREQAEAAQRRSAFLAEASVMLSSSLDYQATLKNVAGLVAEQFADWCAVHLVSQNNSVRILTVAHADPSKLDLAAELARRYSFDPDNEYGVAQVLRTGRAELHPDISDSLLVAAFRDGEYLDIIRRLGLKSLMIVPLVVQGRPVGTISFMSAESGRRYWDEDVTFAKDLARRAALAIDNARLYREAQEANRIKDEFLATLSHELRTPLTAVLGWAELLASGQLDGESSERAIATIQRNANAQSQIIEDILDVSRIISGKMRFDPRPVELIPVIEAAMEAVRPAINAKAIQLESIFVPSASIVSGDPARLQQVIWNLLSNAVKFTSPGGRVEVRLEHLDASARITISDTGDGISADFLPYVFDRFRQADGSTTRAHGGLGLGLAIVRYLVEMHGGRVKAESRGEGQGASFTINLPLSTAGQTQPRPSRETTSAAAILESVDAEVLSPPQLDGLRVLVVDDEADSLNYIDAVLARCGAHVTPASSFAEALQKLHGSG
ncbi:MAG TPA: ATP-binding protein, partial [Pyrinomonadaceae bacterium]